MAENTLETPANALKRPDTIGGWKAALGTLETAPAAIAPVNTAAATAALAEPAPKTEQRQEATKPTEAKPESKAEAATEEAFPEYKQPRTSDDWKKFKTARKQREDELSAERDTIRKEKDELTEKMKGLSSVTDAAEYKAIKEERDKLSEQLRLEAVVRHPKFKAHFDGRVNEQIEIAKSIVGNEKAEQIAKLLQLPDGDWKKQQIRDFVSELDIMEQGQIGSVVTQLRIIDTQKQTAITEAAKDYDSMTAKQKETERQAQEAGQKQISGLIDAGIKAVTDSAKGHPVFQKRDGDTAWNAAVEKRIETVKHLLTGNDVSKEKIFETAIHAVAYHQVLNDYNSLQSEHNKLKEQIKALTAAQPTIDNNRRAGGNGEQPTNIPIKQGSRPMEVTSNWVNRLKIAQNEG